jgi:hypothetical protein
MNTKLTGFITETLYVTFIATFYVYIFMTTVQLKPFALGFHPPSDIEQLSVIVLGIYTVVFIGKSFSLVSFWMNLENPNTPHKSSGFFPAHRH